MVALREKGGMSQRDLATRLGREHTFVGRIELGERRLGIVEFYWVAKALEQDPDSVARGVMRELSQL